MSKLTQVVSGNGDFKEDEVENFIRENGVETAGLDYQVIAITGPQSSGKSTLMNVLVRDWRTYTSIYPTKLRRKLSAIVSCGLYWLISYQEMPPSLEVLACVETTSFKLGAFL